MKKSLFLILAFLISGICAFAQSDNLPAPPDTGKIFVYVAQMPEYPGGFTEMYKFLATNINYPKSALEKRKTGKCFVRFVVQADGAVGQVELQKGIPGCPECDAEAIRVVKMLPAFKPAINEGKPVPVWYQLPINFTLPDPNKKEEGNK